MYQKIFYLTATGGPAGGHEKHIRKYKNMVCESQFRPDFCENHSVSSTSDILTILTKKYFWAAILSISPCDSCGSNKIIWLLNIASKLKGKELLLFHWNMNTWKIKHEKSLLCVPRDGLFRLTIYFDSRFVSSPKHSFFAMHKRSCPIDYLYSGLYSRFSSCHPGGSRNLLSSWSRHVPNWSPVAFCISDVLEWFKFYFNVPILK